MRQDAREATAGPAAHFWASKLGTVSSPADEAHTLLAQEEGRRSRVMSENAILGIGSYTRDGVTFRRDVHEST
jgi:hypothetical protein